MNIHRSATLTCIALYSEGFIEGKWMRFNGNDMWLWVGDRGWLTDIRIWNMRIFREWVREVADGM